MLEWKSTEFFFLPGFFSLLCPCVECDSGRPGQSQAQRHPTQPAGPLHHARIPGERTQKLDQGEPVLSVLGLGLGGHGGGKVLTTAFFFCFFGAENGGRSAGARRPERRGGRLGRRLGPALLAGGQQHPPGRRHLGPFDPLPARPRSNSTRTGTAPILIKKNDENLRKSISTRDHPVKPDENQ